MNVRGSLKPVWPPGGGGGGGAEEEQRRSRGAGHQHWMPPPGEGTSDTTPLYQRSLSTSSGPTLQTEGQL